MGGLHSTGQRETSTPATNQPKIFKEHMLYIIYQILTISLPRIGYIAKFSLSESNFQPKSK